MPVLFADPASTGTPHQSRVLAAVERWHDRQHGLCDSGVSIHRPGDARATLCRSAPLQGNHPRPALGPGGPPNRRGKLMMTLIDEAALQKYAPASALA